jgi:hypothetical protein
MSVHAHPVLPHAANKIIELAKAGERNPDLLCERAMTDLGHRQISVGHLAKTHPARAVSDEQASAALTAHAAELLERAAALETEAAPGAISARARTAACRPAAATNPRRRVGRPGQHPNCCAPQRK